MRDSVLFLAGLLERTEPAQVAAEDLDGKHRSLLRLCQRAGFLSREPGMNPVPSCPHCFAGVPYELNGRYVCNRCASVVDPRHLLLWRFDLGMLLRFIARKLNLRGEVWRVDERLWQLGSLRSEQGLTECFFCRGVPSDTGWRRLSVYRSVLLIQGVARPVPLEGFFGARVSLIDLLTVDRSLRVADVTELLRPPGARVYFDSESGTLQAGDRALGELPFGSKEYHFLACLAASLDRTVPYADLKHYVLRQAGSTDATEEATFCHRLKYRIKRKWMPQIDMVLVTAGQAAGYRLRGSIDHARQAMQ